MQAKPNGPIVDPVHSANALLGAVSRPVRRRVLAGCALVDLVPGQVLSRPGKRVRQVYFPTRGYISLTALDSSASVPALGIVGDEGMLGVFRSLGIEVSSPLHATVQGEGAALRMETVACRRQLAANPGLLRVVNRYCYVRFNQVVQTAACNRCHLVEQRLARRLLMTQDRAHSDAFHVTQEALARMLGVRRPGVSAAAMALKHRGLIGYHRGDMTILDRRGLKAAACACYAADRNTYNQVMARY